MRWVSIREAERSLRRRGVAVSRTSIGRWVKGGYIHYVELPGGSLRVNVDEIERIATPRINTPTL
jgi:predicted site-specific integrase-resolvase